MKARNERKLPKRWIPLVEWWFKYDDYFDDPDGFEFSSYDEACEEFERDAEINNKSPESHFLAVRTIFEMQLDKIEKAGEQRKQWLIEALKKIYKELN